MIEEEKFFAWLDGELDADEAARVETEVAADSALLRKAEQHRALAASLKGAFGAVASASVPERIASPARSRDDNVLDMTQARAARQPAARPLWKQMAALAATLAVGVFTGSLLTGNLSGGSGPIAAEDGRLVASADLEGALYTRLASAPADSGPRIGLTFRDKSGAICRTFADHAASGLACLEGGDWRIRGVFQGATGPAADYRMASGGDPRLMDMVDDSIAGEPFDAAQERTAMERGWR